MTGARDRAVEDEVRHQLAQGLGSRPRDDLIAFSADDRDRNLGAVEGPCGINLVMEEQADGEPWIETAGDLLQGIEGRNEDKSGDIAAFRETGCDAGSDAEADCHRALGPNVPGRFVEYERCIGDQGFVFDHEDLARHVGTLTKGLGAQGPVP